MENNKNKLKVKKLKENAVIPKRQTIGSAGYDLCACIAREFKIEPGEMVIIPTGIAIEVPKGYAGMVFARSGISLKYGIHLSNGVGVIDSDYRGEVNVGLKNSSHSAYVVKPNERIAQLIIMPVLLPEIEETNEMTETERSGGGLGSTGR